MGLASSQARLLLLTARKSDLEYRSQMISQRKIMLAMETEQLATEYTRSLSNRLLYFVFDQNGSTTETMSEVLNYNGLVGENNESMIGKYIVTDAMGRMVIPETGKVPSGFTSVKEGDKEFAVYKDKNGNVTQKFEINVCKDVSNAYVFQNALRNGGLYVQKLNSESGQFESHAWQSSTQFQDRLYKEDDDVAQSKYETQSLTIQNQDKMLDLELKQIETQHKAIETEYDSVKKVIDKNIETSYKIFANG